MRHILFLSGAGLSADSGIRTFRDSGGLWEEYSISEVCSTQGWLKDRDKVMNFYDQRRADLRDKSPNLAHEMIAHLQNQYPQNVSVLTQNVDDLLERAGCKNVVHLHGTLRDLRCEDCEEVFDIGYERSKGVKCPKCQSENVRHNVVMFGEAAPEYEVLYRELDRMDMFVCIGTSGEVIDVANFTQFARFSLLNNLDKNPMLDKAFDLCLHESAVDASIQIDKYCRYFIQNGEFLKI